jgi:hypothetical protein
MATVSNPRTSRGTVTVLARLTKRQALALNRKGWPTAAINTCISQEPSEQKGTRRTKTGNGPETSERLLCILAVISFETVIERLQADAKQLRRARFIAAGKIDGSHHQFPFDFVQ